jgi:hypothetical protein
MKTLKPKDDEKQNIGKDYPFRSIKIPTFDDLTDKDFPKHN